MPNKKAVVFDIKNYSSAIHFIYNLIIRSVTFPAAVFTTSQ
jgi:hypothetical protein